MNSVMDTKNLDSRGYPQKKLARTKTPPGFKKDQRNQLDRRGRDIYEKYQAKYALAHLYRKHNQLLLARMSEHLPPTAKVLEVGSGFGNFLVDAKNRYDVTGLEHSLVHASLARKILGQGAKIINGDGEMLPFSTGSYNGVLVKGVVAHFAEIQAAFKEIHRVLHDDGVFFLMEGVNNASYRALTYRTADIFGIKHDHGIFRHLSSHELIHHAQRSGFEVLEKIWIPGPFDPLAYLGWGGAGIWSVFDKIERLLGRAGLGLLFRYYLLVIMKKEA